MDKQAQSIKPQDIVLLLKIISNSNDAWNQKPIAKELGMSQSEISESVARSKFAGLLDVSGKKVFRRALMDLLQYGIRYIFPQRPGAMVRGVPTAHSAKPLNQIIQSEENYVWPSAKGSVRGQSILPLYPSVSNAVEFDTKLHELLALVDALRVGKIREQELAVKELQTRIL